MHGTSRTLLFAKRDESSLVTNRGVAWGWVVSFQIGVLKVLSAHPEGRASVSAIKRDLITLASREWSHQLRELAALAPNIDVFSSGLIIRTPDAWQITATGRAFMHRLQNKRLHGTIVNIIASAAPAPPEPPKSVIALNRPIPRPERRDTHQRTRRAAIISR